MLGYALAGELGRDAALLQSPQLLRRVCGDAYDEIKPIIHAGLKKKWHLDYESFASSCRKNVPPMLGEARMEQILQPLEGFFVSKNNLRQSLAPNCTSRVCDSLAELCSYLSCYRGAGQQDIADNRVGIEPPKSVFGKNCSCG